jgi:site-specific DNA-cytosine methylase
LNPSFVEWMLGFPDGWTDGERRTHRLRMLGNSVQVQCGEYVGQILMEALHAGA